MTAGFEPSPMLVLLISSRASYPLGYRDIHYTALFNVVLPIHLCILHLFRINLLKIFIAILLKFNRKFITIYNLNLSKEFTTT